MAIIEDFFRDAMDLEGRSFEHAKRRYDCTGVKRVFGKVSIFCAQRTFVWTVVQLQVFLSELRVIDEKENLPLKQNSMSNVIVQGQVDAGVSVADKLTKGLMEEFEILSGTPTEADFKRAEAKGKVAHTVIAIEQTKIGYLKLKGNV